MKVVLVGYGQMGKMLEGALTERGDEIAGVVHPGLFASAADVPGPFDAIVDFSYPGNLAGDLRAVADTGCALVLGTTGLSGEQARAVQGAGEFGPVVFSANYSLGVAVLKSAVALAAKALGADFDCEIVETHHRRKADAPSGTAKMLLAAADPEGSRDVLHGREGIIGPRGREIGVHSLRGGTVPGEHSVYFFGEDEILELKHTALSRRVFVSGAIKALDFAVGRAKGLYTIDDALGLV